MRQRNFLVAAVGAVLLGAITMTSVPASAHPGKYRSLVVNASTKSPVRGNKDWKLVFKDDFTHGLAKNAWDVYTTGGSSNPGMEWFAQSHVTVSGGQLHIKGYVDRKVMSDGRIVTGGLGLWQRPMRYGKYEVLVRMQSCPQVKYAWMLWPYSNNWPTDGEIDFAEDEGGNRALTTASLNYAGADDQRRTLKQDYATPTNTFAAWHVMGVEWTPHAVRYTMDGHHWGTTKTTHIPKTPMVFVMQTEGKALPDQVTQTGTCNADIGWVAQWAYRG